MKRFLMSALAGALLAGLSLAQNPAPSQSAPQDSSAAGEQSGASANASQEINATAKARLQPGSVLYVALAKSLDAKKAKQGDEVVAKSEQALLSQGRIVMPAGAKIVGHVTEAKPHSKDQPQSELGIVFDHIALKDGSQMPLSVTIQAIGKPADSATAATLGNEPSVGEMSPRGGSRPQPAGGMSGGNMGGGGRYPTGGQGNPSGMPPDTGGSTNSAAGHLNAASHGVVGLPDLAMSGAAANSTQGSLITSEKKNVKLDSGTEMVLRVNNQ